MDRYLIEPTQTRLYQIRGIYKGWIESGKLFCRTNLQMGHEKWKYKNRVLHERGGRWSVEKVDSEFKIGNKIRNGYGKEGYYPRSQTLIQLTVE